ncbi:1,4-alpha-glucan branching protein [Desulfonema ishimotonii]|uniref:1,4-alpha-glucan branching enzyme n=1 Tax=Desulfonema ishimotonii TaxID=45657 RepID=A0A401FTK1_9BACT|nr:alpha amylase C-terminal domain-containing protein [Desulfonema ishimotonii]GBC60307.1 1,4-alpha-glucan branching protein [Desulfonema ishimotonii]
MKTSEATLPRLLKKDSYLRPYREIIENRMRRVRETEKRLTSGETGLADFASGHEYFGLHYREGQWIFREWAPNATGLFLIGEMTGWREEAAFALERINDQGVWEIRLPRNAFRHGDLYRLRIHWPDNRGDRIPAYARRVVQDPETRIFNAQVWQPPLPYHWKNPVPRISEQDEQLLIYEVHTGMAQEAEKIGSYSEFTGYILPRIVRAGYNTIQLMAVQEHPYYGSFGYQVSNFFAASSRFGTPDELKALVDAAHGAGLRVIMDLVHSHAVSNETEGLSRFDGTPYQYFHEGPRGRHTAWDSRCFDYGKPQVLHFLLSNCRFWLDEYRFDGFRFDGVTSMLYRDHGLGKAFTAYDDYFSDNLDEDALTCLALANRVTHAVRPDAITIAEDVSGMPGLAAPVEDGGVGFDYRFAMGVPDYWIRLTKEVADEDWPTGHLWYELNNRRPEEKTISYAESHDQALVGDKTLIFRLIDADIYDHMRKDDQNFRVDRGMALHKMIRLITLATAGNGYLNFMGNEFGHPEWIDFPREGNRWSLRYARRQWSLADHPDLKYRFLADFDRDMIAMVRRCGLLSHPNIPLLKEHHSDKVILFSRAGLIFAFNFHPTRSHSDYPFHAAPGEYRMILDSDAADYGGQGRLSPDQHHLTQPENGSHQLRLYLPTRTAIVLEPVGKVLPK